MSKDVETPQDKLVRWIRETIEVYGVDSAVRNLKKGLERVEENEEGLRKYKKFVDSLKEVSE